MVRAIKTGALAAAALSSFVAVNASAINPALDVASGRYTLGITGFVPVICRASVDATSVPVAAGEVSLGTLSEFCNSPNGYEIYADHSDALAKGSLIIGGQKVQLSQQGSTRIRKTNRAGIANNGVTLEVPKGVTSAQISFRIVPL
ncbi:hypothetical protein [Sphingomonas sp. MS122]|uniref:hypothetical protein n=1 Tax=Sphingomonas sp. MS122 TaxID=3412683 RepID=UPI003C2B3B4F